MIINKAGIENQASLLAYLQDVQEDFDPPLFNRISKRSTVKGIEEYLDKVLHNGTLLYGTIDGNICGIVVVYHNDQEGKKAYIPLLSVKRAYSGKGIAKLLVSEAVDLAFSEGMESVLVKTWKDNVSAQKIYTGLGFTIVDASEDIIFKKVK